jgi:hypothetical protein
MGKGGGGQIEITRYYMALHFGVCAGADAITKVTIKEKVAWTGNVTAQGTFKIDNDQLFGGREKEGGIEAVVYWLPGGDTQVLDDHLAQRLGQATGADVPGYRGVATAFFVGAKGTAYPELIGADGPRYGAYWSANNPYLPGVWITVRRAPVGLNPDYALVPRPGTEAGGTVLAAYDLFDEFEPLSTGDPGYPPPGTLHPSTITIGPFIHPFQVICTSLVMNADDLWVLNGVDGNHIYTLGAVLGVVPAGESWTLQVRNTADSGTSALGTIEAQSLPNTAEDANPAHIIYECLTNVDWGMGSPTTAIDTDSFEDAGVTLYNDGFGLSMIWTRQAEIHKFIQEILDHINAVIFVDPGTGLLTMKLIRGDYDVATLPNINPDNADLSSFNRKLWGEIPNEIVVSWTNPETEQEETAPPAQDLASIAIQGLISDSRNYYGVRYGELATRLAWRELASSGQPLATIEAEVDRTQYLLRPASAVTVTWPEHGLDELVMRATSVDYGRPGDPTIKLSLIEDVFGLDAGDYVAPPSSGWVDPSEAPEPLTIERLFTLPLFFANQSPAAGFVDTPEYPEVVAGILATTTQADAFSFDLWDEVTLSNGDLQWQEIGSELNILGHATLTGSLIAEATSTSVGFSSLIGDTGPLLAGFVIIGDDGEEGNEIAQIDATGATYTLRRGVLDTVPRAWPAGTPVWFVDENTIYEDSTVRAAAEVMSVKLLTRTSQGLLALADAALVSHTLTERPWLPNRPAKVEIDGVKFNTVSTPVEMIGASDVPVTWANRNRLDEDTQVLGWTDATVTPETGQTTKIEVRTPDLSTVLTTHDSLSGTSFNVPFASFAGESVGAIQVWAERSDGDGDFTSLQAHVIWVQVAVGELVTEEGDFLLTEDDDVMILEG